MSDGITNRTSAHITSAFGDVSRTLGTSTCVDPVVGPKRQDTIETNISECDTYPPE
jgi:hypothetical protein